MGKTLFILLFFIIKVQGQIDMKPEAQISFAKEKKPHSYYVKQGELWWDEVVKSPKSENNWFNYYRACRNAQGTNDWKDDFLKESNSMRLGSEIVKLMEVHIPDTFTYNYVKGSTSGVDPAAGKYLLKAYNINPDFEGIDSDVITYAVSSFDFSLREKVNNYWFKKNDISIAQLSYAYNVLSSVGENGILLTEHDNDTYPIWMLQDVFGFRKDVLVINIDFLLLESFREVNFKQLHIPKIDLVSTNINEYGLNWKSVMNHLLLNYNHVRPLHVALTVNPKLYENHNEQLFLIGLTKKFSRKQIPTSVLNGHLVSNVFLFDYLRIDLTGKMMNHQVNAPNENYLKLLEDVCRYFRKNKRLQEMNRVKELLNLIGSSTSKTAVKSKTKNTFR